MGRIANRRHGGDSQNHLLIRLANAHDARISALARWLDYCASWQYAELVKQRRRMQPTTDAMAAAAVLGVQATSDDDVVERIRRGLPSRALRSLRMKLGISPKQLALALNIPERTLVRRIASASPIPMDESDRIYRVARIYHAAAVALGNENAAVAWLLDENPALGNAPLYMLDTEVGTREVENVLGHIKFGDTFA